MDFKIDEQSYKDLNIFRSNENRFALFDLYKNTRTVGGRALMEAWMRNPSNAIHHLQKRTEAIAFFVKSGIELNINHDQFDLILHYLNYDKGYLRNNLLDSFIPWIANRIKPSQDYYVVQIGITYLLDLLKHASELTSSLLEANAPELLVKLANKVTRSLEDPDINYACSLASKRKLTFYQLGKLDSILRGNSRLLLMDLLSIFYELDVLETLGKVVHEREMCLATYLNNENISVKIEGLFHPALTAPIKNNIKIDESNNLIFLSGSNMAGKSSLLKSIGLAIYLAHLGFPVPANSMQTVVFNGLITTINLADNIENGLSHYYSEVMRVKKVASLLVERNRMFVILDELFRGTNPKDAFDASLLVLNGFSAIPSSIFIISSHITELTSELKAKNIEFNYLEHLMVDRSAVFTYQLKRGVAKDGIGMYFMEKENILGLLKMAKN